MTNAGPYNDIKNTDWYILLPKLVQFLINKY